MLSTKRRATRLVSYVWKSMTKVGSIIRQERGELIIHVPAVCFSPSVRVLNSNCSYRVTQATKYDRPSPWHFVSKG
jgi:hypothetical protein